MPAGKAWLLVFVFFAFLFVFSSISFARGSPVRWRDYPRERDFYDWSSYRGGKVLAEATPSAVASVATPSADLAKVGFFLPGHRFYFVVPLVERVKEIFTFNPQKREDLRLRHAERRLSEAKALLERGESLLARDTIMRYEDSIDRLERRVEEARETGRDIEELVEKLEERAALHNLVLEEVLVKAPKEAEEALLRAIEVSQRGLDTAADALGRDPIPPVLKERFEALKNQGLLAEEELSGIYSLDSRRKVRKRLKALLEEGFVPLADFKLLDERQRELYEEHFDKIHEWKKFEEWEDLEDLYEERLDEEMVRKLERFKRTYKVGDSVPPELRRFLPFLRFEELKKTIRPDFIDPEMIKKDKKHYDRFWKFVVDVKPSGRDLAHLEEFRRLNPGRPLPPELERLEAIRERFGSREEIRMPEGFSGPGGCRNERQCWEYCRQPVHQDECRQFAPEYKALPSPPPPLPIEGEPVPAPGLPPCPPDTRIVYPEGFCERETTIPSCPSGEYWVWSGEDSTQGRCEKETWGGEMPKPEDCPAGQRWVWDYTGKTGRCEPEGYIGPPVEIPSEGCPPGYHETPTGDCTPDEGYPPPSPIPCPEGQHLEEDFCVPDIPPSEEPSPGPAPSLEPSPEPYPAPEGGGGE